MLFAIQGRFKPGMQDRVASLQQMFSAHLEQPVLRIHLGGPLRDAAGEKVGLLILIDAPSLEAAQAFVADSPFTKAGLYAEMSIDRFDVEVGTV